MAPHGLTTLQFTTLSVLSRHGAPLSTSQLARRAFMTPQSMSEVIHALERKGLIKRKPHPNHRRTLPATFTPKGRRVLASCEEAVSELESTMLEGFSDGDRDGVPRHDQGGGSRTSAAAFLTSNGVLFQVA